MNELSERVLADLEGRPEPEACRAMTEVRAGVDALDRALVAILAERMRYMDAAARIKLDRGAVRDEGRIEDVVAKVLAAAARDGLPAEVAEPLWRLLIDRCIAYELQAHERLHG